MKKKILSLTQVFIYIKRKIIHCKKCRFYLTKVKIKLFVYDLKVKIYKKKIFIFVYLEKARSIIKVFFSFESFLISRKVLLSKKFCVFHSKKVLIV